MNPTFSTLILCICFSLPLQSQQVKGSWRIVPTPNGGSDIFGNVLLGAAAISKTDAWAVGAEPNQSDFLTATLAEHWDGKQFSIVPTPQISEPTAQLNSIIPVAGNDVWAAGYSDNPSCLCGKTVVEHWDGRSWVRIKTPTPGIAAYLSGMSAASSTDVWAVGYGWISQSTSSPVVLHYNGQHWSGKAFATLPFGSLRTVFATAADDAWAIGNILSGDIQVLALHWDGKFWRRASFPSEEGGYIQIYSVSGTAKNDLWAVGTLVFAEGSAQIARAYHWNGTTWKRVNIPGLAQPSYFLGLSVIASDDAWAVGQGVVLPQLNVSNITYHWDGHRWKDVVNPDQTGLDVLNAVSASSSSDVWTVGRGFALPIPGTFAMHYGVP
jgi:hypothetical protein